MNSYFIPESDEIYRFAWNVWHRLGNGVSREIYADALELEFFDAGVPYQRDQHIPVYYKNILLPHDYMADFIVRDKIVLRIAAGADITEADKREIVSMLNTSKLSSGMFINYSDSAPQFNRIVAEAKFYTENKSASNEQRAVSNDQKTAPLPAGELVEPVEGRKTFRKVVPRAVRRADPSEMYPLDTQNARPQFSSNVSDKFKEKNLEKEAAL
jgi:GxxExxY protein